MAVFRNAILIIIVCLVVTGCSGKTTTLSTAGIATQNLLPGAIGFTIVPVENTPYPGPSNGATNNPNENSTGNMVQHLSIPTPSAGKSVVSGQLDMTNNNGVSYISKLFLAPIEPSSTPGSGYSINFSEGSDPAATQELGTGSFVFVDVEPGQYALVIWTANRAYPLEDTSGKTIQFSVNPNEVKDLGVISTK